MIENFLPYQNTEVMRNYLVTVLEDRKMGEKHDHIAAAPNKLPKCMHYRRIIKHSAKT
jgi:hypothetical protein